MGTETSFQALNIPWWLGAQELGNGRLNKNKFRPPIIANWTAEICLALQHVGTWLLAVGCWRAAKNRRLGMDVCT